MRSGEMAGGRADVAGIGPFVLEGDDRGVLLLHGFTGTPFEVRAVAERLHSRGMTAVGIALPGHCTTPAELDATRWVEWSAAVERAFERLRERCRRVAVVGQSLGGLLALHLAAHRPDVEALACLGVPLWLTREARALVAAVRRLPALARLGPLKKQGGSDVADRAMWRANPSYPVIPLRALVELDDLRRVVGGELATVTAPMLIVHATHDHVAPYACAGALAARVGARAVERLTLPRSYHIVGLDLERARAGDAIGEFFERMWRTTRPATAPPPTGADAVV